MDVVRNKLLVRAKPYGNHALQEVNELCGVCTVPKEEVHALSLRFSVFQHAVMYLLDTEAERANLVYLLDVDAVSVCIVLEDELLQVHKRPLVLRVLPHLKTQHP